MIIQTAQCTWLFKVSQVPLLSYCPESSSALIILPGVKFRSYHTARSQVPHLSYCPESSSALIILPGVYHWHFVVKPSRSLILHPFLPIELGPFMQNTGGGTINMMFDSFNAQNVLALLHCYNNWVFFMQNTGGGTINMMFDSFNAQWSSNCTTADYVYPGIASMSSGIAF